MRHRPRTVRGAVIAASVVAVIAVLAGCVSVPTSGKVEQARHPGSVSTERNAVVPKPPPRDAKPKEIVEGFLLAMTHNQSNYRTARRYLSSGAREDWHPQDGATIYNNRRFKTSGTNVKMSMNKSGKLGKKFNYTAQTGKAAHDFKLRRTRRGQWRISNPPKGLLISDTSFSNSYSAYNVYFFDPQFKTLVPEPVYLPSAAQTATALVRRLLDGPTSWLHPAVSSAAPAKNNLMSNNSVPIEHHLAKITLGKTALDLDPRQRKRLAIQLAWTLKQVENSEIDGMQITVDGDRFHVPGEKTQKGKTYVSTGIGDRYDPVGKPRDMIAGVRHGDVMTMKPSDAHPKPEPIDGPLGSAEFPINSVALNAEGKSVAAVTDGNSQLRTQSTDDHQARTALTGKRHLLRPVFARHDELWAISGKPKAQQFLVIKNKHAAKVHASWLSKVNITAFRIASDGTRMAVIIQRHGKQRLAMAPIIRGDETSLGKLHTVRVIDNASAPIDRITGLGWISPTRVMIVGASGKRGANEPYGVDIDGSHVDRLGVSDHWDTKSVSAVPYASESFRAVVGGRHDKAWIYRNGDRWPSLNTHLLGPVYAGG